jgi:hypothetical protein
MHNGCEECDRLWKEYAIATHEHLRLDSKLQIAGLSHDHQTVQQLTPDVTESCQRRMQSREQIADHEQKCHSVPDKQRESGSSSS